jgi:N-acetylglucosamine-6-phosphate deacetylase
MRGIANCKRVIDKGDSTIIGMHFEGPFTNPNYGSNKERTWKYSRDLCDMIFEAAKGYVLHCTYAPEMPHGEEMEQILKEYGIVADIGHTEVGPEDAERAVKNGAKIVTHLFDAMGCWRGKEFTKKSTGVRVDSADMVLLAIPGLYYELICDSRGVHVKPENARMAYRTAGEDFIILVTDCADLRDYDPADYPPEHKRSTPDIYYNDAGELSASCLDMTSACKNFMRFTGADVRVAFKCASTNPAKALSMEERIGSILPGRDANLLIVDEAFNLQDVYFRGERVE